MKLNLIRVIKEKLDEKRPINIFGRSIFESMDDCTSNRDRFIDMVKLYRSNSGGIQNDSRFIRSINILDRMRETYYFEKYITNSPFGPMLDIDYIDPTQDDGDGGYVHMAISQILGDLSEVVFSNSYTHEEDKHTWITFGYELNYESQFKHAVLVIPYKSESGYTEVCRMVISCKEKMN